MEARRPPADVALGRIVDHYACRHDDAESWMPALSQDVRRRGYFTLEEFRRVCTWKASRAARRWRDRTEEEVVTATRNAIRCGNDEARMELLLAGLKGVRVPIASAILAAYDPRKYGVIDVRAWQALFALGLVREKPSGTELAVQDWCAYVKLLRRYAHALGTTPRRLDFSLWLFHHCLYPERIPPKAADAIPAGQHCMFRWLLD